MRILAATSTAVVLAVLAVQSAGAAASWLSFQTPSRNIACSYHSGILRCEIGGGLEPLPPKPVSCSLDWGYGLKLRLTGRAYVLCAGDTIRQPDAPVLAYGSTWRRSGLSCVSRTTGLTCRNAAGHGFFLSRKRWRRF